MSTLIIYDNNGVVFTQITGSYIIPGGGLQYLETVIPDGKMVSGVNVTVTPNVPIFVNIPPTQEEKNRADIDYIAVMTGVNL